MRPLQLTMTAFGPYKDTEVIDFNELGNERLFVISGNTGAGKTTIFDGISFALYGSASGTDRENHTMLRSDFADDDIHTSVELIFEINSQVYRVLRQLGHVKKGNKSKTGDRYELFKKVDGQEIPCVDRQIVSEIDRKIEEVIGITQDQFKQIVMLPQGEFRKLLTSQTENKEEILRRLFKTEPYKNISERLKRKKDMIEESFIQEKQTENHYIQAIGATLPAREESSLFHVLAEAHYNVNQLVEGLSSEIDFYEQQISVDEQNYTKSYEAHDKKYVAFHQAKTLNERFDALHKKEQLLKELTNQESLFSQKDKQLKDAERASQLEPYERQAEDRRKDEQAKRITLAQAEEATKEADNKFKQAHNIFEQEQAKQNVREEVSRKLDRLKDYLPTIQAIDQSKQHLHVRKQKVEQSSKQLETMNHDIKVKAAMIEKNHEQIKQMDEHVNQLPDKQQTLTNMREQARVCIDYVKLVDQQKKLRQDVELQTKAFNKLKNEYESLESAWLSGQASILATHLHDGESCPVCGSHEHPHKAVHNKEGVTRVELEAAKKALDKQEALYRTSVANDEVHTNHLQVKGEEVEMFNIPLADVTIVRDALIDKGKRQKAEVDHLQAISEQLIVLKGKQEKETAEMKQLDEEKNKVEQVYLEHKSSYEKDQAVFEERLRVVPADVRVLSELEKMINETNQLKAKLETKWEASQKNLQEAKDLQTKTVTDEVHAKKQVKEAIDKRAEVDQQFKEALIKAAFHSNEAYQQAKLSIADRQQLKESIDTFNQKLTTVKHEVATIQGDLKDKQKVDVTVLEHELRQLKEAYERALNQWNQSKKLCKEATVLKSNILQANERVKKHEQELGVITDLYDMIRGQNNPKISFERYLQIEYLEQIIAASNIRLKQLSNGQFLLMRSNRQEARGRQSGLAFDVYDAYTGQTRDVKTLSGGEKFNTSLCLALGMSDVIQSFQGNISIDTMFIDEGFGSLDEESLNKSIDTLIDLQQSGRMIGVISHVQELKSIFPAVLEVTKTKEGYSKTTFVVK